MNLFSSRREVLAVKKTVIYLRSLGYVFWEQFVETCAYMTDKLFLAVGKEACKMRMHKREVDYHEYMIIQ